jgi:uncharacterized protein (DUF305 family)
MQTQQTGVGALVDTRWRRLAIVGMMVVAVTATACNDDDSTGPDATVDEQRSYIDNIVPHHQIALIRADEALAKAVHQGLKNIATRMKEDQGREIAEFKAIRQQLVGSDTTPPPMMPQPIPAGADFDRQWLLMMINHHQTAINNSTLAHGANVQSRIDSLAHHTIDEQRREQQEFRDSLAVWYGSGS